MPDKAHLAELAATEQALFAEVMDEELPSNDSDRSLEDVEGWDGKPLGLDEIAAANIDNTMVDRPLQMEREINDEIGRRDQEIQQLRQQLAEQHALADPDFITRQARARDDAITRVLSDPEGTLRDMQSLAQQTQQAHMQRVEMSMREAHRTYGAEWEAANRALTRLNPRDPVDCAIVQHKILSQPNPGAALVQWHRSTTGGRSSNPPFARGLNRGTRAEPVERDYSPEDMEDVPNMGGGAEFERDLMRSVWED